ncbi:hypothetical protein CP985_03285 [Malaciobacter mytili LMG 24559]|uniref:Uncharacterized protein n=2 Tax=Malaciobacter mytili TaxID=603050 RepID=A0AAX2AHE8_9BACT|nr:hypothetical protein CP985_03285 [Malaciobacter mytili LMG 24559]
MNYYQDSNQPKLDNDKSDIRIFNNEREAKASFGSSGFRCSTCKGISTDPYDCNSGIKNSNGKVCNWKSYGLLTGVGSYIFLKNKMIINFIFTPIAWEK